MPSVSQRTIYYLPGYGGQLGTGLGQGLMDRGFDVTGRETRGDFRNLPFDEQVQTVMQDLQDQFGLAFLFISHDLAVVNLVCDEVIVLYQGRIVERGAPQALFRAARHPYTRRLLAAVPGAKRDDAK